MHKVTPFSKFTPKAQIQYGRFPARVGWQRFAYLDWGMQESGGCQRKGDISGEKDGETEKIPF